MNLITIHTKIKNHFKSGAVVLLKEESSQIVVKARHIYNSDMLLLKSFNRDIKNICINKKELTLNF